MKSQNLATNARDVPTGILRLDSAEERGKNEPPLAEIRQRAFEIHIERGGIHGCDLDDWVQAERELKEKYHQRNGEASKSK
jgi:hypothetical protein